MATIRRNQDPIRFEIESDLILYRAKRYPCMYRVPFDSNVTPNICIGSVRIERTHIYISRGCLRIEGTPICKYIGYLDRSIEGNLDTFVEGPPTANVTRVRRVCCP